MVDGTPDGTMSARVICKMARESLDLTQGRLGAYVGHDHSWVSRIEGGNRGMSPGMVAFSELVLKLLAVPAIEDPSVQLERIVTKDQILAALDAVPKGRRSEHTAIMALDKLARDRKREDAIEAVVGSGLIVPEDEQEGVEPTMASVMALKHHFEDMKAQVKSFWRKAPPDIQPHYFEMVKLIAQIEEHAEAAAEKEAKGRKSARRADHPDPEAGGEA